MPALTYLVLSDTQPLLEQLHRRGLFSKKKGKNGGGPSVKLDALYVGSFVAAILILALLVWLSCRFRAKKKEG
ncbi:hypothetical protein FPOAC2_13084 [Fusarium poae]